MTGGPQVIPSTKEDEDESFSLLLIKAITSTAREKMLKRKEGSRVGFKRENKEPPSLAELKVDIVHAY
jgi:hypothetical protein